MNEGPIFECTVCKSRTGSCSCNARRANLDSAGLLNNGLFRLHKRVHAIEIIPPTIKTLAPNLYSIKYVPYGAITGHLEFIKPYPVNDPAIILYMANIDESLIKLIKESPHRPSGVVPKSILAIYQVNEQSRVLYPTISSEACTLKWVNLVHPWEESPQLHIHHKCIFGKDGMTDLSSVACEGCSNAVFKKQGICSYGSRTEGTCFANEYGIAPKLDKMISQFEPLYLLFGTSFHYERWSGILTTYDDTLTAHSGLRKELLQHRTRLTHELDPQSVLSLLLPTSRPQHVVRYPIPHPTHHLVVTSKNARDKWDFEYRQYNDVVHSCIRSNRITDMEQASWGKLEACGGRGLRKVLFDPEVGHFNRAIIVSTLLTAEPSSTKSIRLVADRNNCWSIKVAIGSKTNSIKLVKSPDEISTNIASANMIKAFMFTSV